MSIVCDFCPKVAERHEDTLFLESPSELAHICEDCVAGCASLLSRKKLTMHKRRATTKA